MSFGEVHNVLVEVAVSQPLKNGVQTIDLTPSSPLVMDLEHEEITEALEVRYGWEKFLAEVREHIAKRILCELEVNVLGIKVGEVSKEEHDGLIEFLMEVAPEFFE